MHFHTLWATMSAAVLFAPTFLTIANAIPIEITRETSLVQQLQNYNTSDLPHHQPVALRSLTEDYSEILPRLFSSRRLTIISLQQKYTAQYKDESTPRSRPTIQFSFKEVLQQLYPISEMELKSKWDQGQQQLVEDTVKLIVLADYMVSKDRAYLRTNDGQEKLRWLIDYLHRAARTLPTEKKGLYHDLGKLINQSLPMYAKYTTSETLAEKRTGLSEAPDGENTTLSSGAERTDSVKCYHKLQALRIDGTIRRMKMRKPRIMASRTSSNLPHISSLSEKKVASCRNDDPWCSCEEWQIYYRQMYYFQKERENVVTFPRLGEVLIEHDHLLEISSTGYITHSSSGAHGPADVDITLPNGSFLIPPFIDLHLHAPQFLYQGTGLHLPLMQWLDEYAYKAEERIDNDPILAQKVYSRLAERLIQNGTGTALLFGTIKEESNLILASCFQSAGLRGFIGKLSMDISTRPSYTEHTASQSLSAAKSFITHCRSLNNIHPVITPRFVPTCSDSLLSGLSQLSSSENVLIQSHLSESSDQLAWVHATRDGLSDLTIFDNHSLLTPRTIQAHCTFLDPPSLSLLSQRGTSIAHCPLSNAYFSDKPFPMKEALEANVKVGLGTDVAGGYSLDIMDSMRWSVGVARMREGQRLLQEGNKPDPKVLNWKASLYLATKGGADALGLPSNTGTFAVGAPFDAQFIRLFDPTSLSGIGNLDFFDLKSDSILNEEMLEKWWCIGDVRNRAGMWIQGQQVGKW